MLPRLLAVLLPWVPVALFFVGSGLLVPENTELPAPASGHTARMLLTLNRDSEVLIIGNSQAESAVDSEALGQQLGIPGKVGTVVLPGLHADGAYALLKYRIFGAALRPRVIILPMSIDHLLDTRPPADHNLKTLMENIPGSDPVLDLKEFGAGEGAHVFGPRWTRAVGRLQASRDEALEHLTAFPLRWWGEGAPSERMDAARDAVLGKIAGANLALQVRVLPAAGAAQQTALPALAKGIENTLLPDLVQLIKDADAKLVVATVPQKLQALGTRPEAAREVAEWLQAQGVPFLHLERIGVPVDGWRDPAHLGLKGEALYTELLGEKLVELEVLGQGGMKMPALPVQPPRVTRAGDPPQPTVKSQTATADGCLVRLKLDVPLWRSDAFLSKVGMGCASLLQATADGQPLVPHVAVNENTGCTGRMWHAVDSLVVAPPSPSSRIEVAWAGTPSTRRSTPKEDSHLEEAVYWLPPGGSLSLSWETPPEADLLSVALAELHPGQGAPSAQVGDVSAPLVAWGKTWSGEIRVGERGLRDPLVVTSPPGGPELLLKIVAVHKDGSQQLALGQLGDVPWRMEVSGTFMMDASTPMPSAVLATSPVRSGRALVFDVTGLLATLSSEALIGEVGDERFKNCLPLSARRVGDTSGSSVQGVQQVQPGKVSTIVSPEMGDDWELIWRDQRVCTRRAWVLPGETLSIRPRAPAAVFVGMDQLLLDLAAFPRQGVAKVRLLHGEHLLLDAGIDLTGPRVLTLPLLTELPPWPDGVKMEVTAPEGVFLSVGLGELRPSKGHPWFAIDEQPDAVRENGAL